MPATHCTIKLHRERCPLRDASAAGSMPDAKWNDKNGSGTMPAIERIGCGSDARHGLYDKNGTGKDVLLSAGLLRERCPPDARHELYDKNGSGQQHTVWGFKNLKRCKGWCVCLWRVRCGAEAISPTYLV